MYKKEEPLIFLWIPVAGFWAMERVVAINFLLSRPVVVASVIGLVTGNIKICLLGGVFFEIMGLMDVPVGTKIPKDDTFASFSYCITMSYGNFNAPVEAALFCIVVSYLVMFPVSAGAVFIRWVNKKLYEIYKDELVEGKLIFLGVALSFVMGAVIYSAGTFVVAGLHSLVLSMIKLLHVSIPVLTVLLSLLFGYFSGFFQIRYKEKFIILLLGGLFSWFFI